MLTDSDMIQVDRRSEVDSEVQVMASTLTDCWLCFYSKLLKCDMLYRRWGQNWDELNKTN